MVVNLVVSLPLVCSFSRMRNLLGLSNMKRQDIPKRIVDGVANLLRNSDFLQVSDDGQRIGRGTKLSKPEKVLEQVHRRTLAVSPFEYSIKMEDVASFFSQFAKVNSVRLPHHAGDKRLFCGTALVEFSSEQDAEYILRQGLVYAGADLVLMSKSDFDGQIENTIKKLGKNGPSLSDSSHNKFHTGQIVKFTLERIASGEKVMKKEKSEDKAGTSEKSEGMDRKKESGDLLTDNSRSSLCKESGETVDNSDEPVVPPVDSEVLKDAFQRFGGVKHIEYSGGSDAGYVCFVNSEIAMKARAAVEFAGGIIVKSKFSIALEAVNGELEGEVWKRISPAQPEGERKEGDDKKEKRRGECPKPTRPPKKARKDP